MPYTLFLGFFVGIIVFGIEFFIFSLLKKVQKKHQEKYSTLIDQFFFQFRVQYIGLGILFFLSLFIGFSKEGLGNYIFFYLSASIFYILGIKIFLFGEK